MKIGELVERLESAYETLSKCENAINELKAERDALAAQVGALRDTCSYWINHAKPSGDCSKSEYNTWLALGYQSSAMTKPAQQRLAEIRAQAGRAGFIAGFKLGTETPKPTVENCHPAGMVDFVSYQVEKIAKIKASQYADSIRQEGK